MRFNFVSDELRVSAPAMCVAPASPIGLPRRGDGAMNICDNGSGE